MFYSFQSFSMQNVGIIKLGHALSLWGPHHRSELKKLEKNEEKLLNVQWINTSRQPTFLSSSINLNSCLFINDNYMCGS